MVPDAIPLVAVVFVLGSIAYFEMASIPFLFVRLDIPEVWRLFRGLFNTYFGVIGFIGVVAAGAFATNGSTAFPAAMLLLAATALLARGTVLRLIDSHQAAGRSGDLAAMRRLRVVHWGAMLVNGAILASVAISLPYIF